MTEPDWESYFAGHVIDGNLIGAKLGQGAFGMVFEAKHQHTGRNAAIKLLKPGLSGTDAGIDFNNEATLLSTLGACDGAVNLLGDGKHILQVTTADGLAFPMEVPYQIMTLASGTLNDFSATPDARSRLDFVECLRMWRSAILALSRIHAHKVVHRDIKSDNCLVFVDRSGRTVVRYGDFGRARDLSVPPTRSEQDYFEGRGHRLHAPPEAIYWQGGASDSDFIAADYYGVGSVLIELLTGLSLSQIVIGDFQEAHRQALSDFKAGRRRDLRVLKPKYDFVIGSIVADVPKSVQKELAEVLKHLCHPDASMRLAPAPYSRDRNDSEPLAWVLRRIDIMIRRINIERRAIRRLEGKVA